MFVPETATDFIRAILKIAKLTTRKKNPNRTNKKLPLKSDYHLILFTCI